MALVFQQFVNGLSSGAVYALFALGYTLVFGVLDILNLAHGATYMWGAFAGWVCVTSLHLPIIIALPLAMPGWAGWRWSRASAWTSAASGGWSRAKCPTSRR